MQTGLTFSSPFDTLVYLIPGYVLIIGAVYRVSPQRLRVPHEKVSAGEALLTIPAAFVLGMIIFRFAGAVLDPFFHRLFGESVLTGVINDFPEIAAVRNSLETQLQLSTSPQWFEYIRTIVREHSPQNAEAADRLQAIALLCKSLLIVIPIAGILAFGRRRPKTQLHWRAAVVVTGFLGAEFFLVKGYFVYTTGAAWTVLRAYIVWSTVIVQ